MKAYYEEKMNFHYKQWQLAINNDIAKAEHDIGEYSAPFKAAYHMREYLNYKEMFDNKDNK